MAKKAKNNLAKPPAIEDSWLENGHSKECHTEWWICPCPVLVYCSDSAEAFKVVVTQSVVLHSYGCYVLAAAG